jgi:hypothetical protein
MNEQKQPEPRFEIGAELLVAAINQIMSSPTGQSSLAQVNAIVTGLRQLKQIEAEAPAIKPTGRTMPVDHGDNGSTVEAQPEA